MATLAQEIPYQDGSGKQGDGLFKFISLLQSWSELRAYNMIPFHGIRSSFGTRLAFSFLGCFACGHQKTVLRPLGGKVFRVGRAGESGVGAAVSDYCRCFKL